MEKLAANIRKNYMDRHQRARMLSLVLYKLSNFLGRQQRYQEALDVCNEAITTGQKGEVYGNIPKLMYNKAYALIELGQASEANAYLRLSYCGHTLMGRTDRASGVKERAKRNWGIDIGD